MSTATHHVPLPEQTFFVDPALDRAVAMIMTLAAELHVVRDRLRALEVLLERNGTIEAGQLDGYIPEGPEAVRAKEDLEGYVRELLHCTTGRQASKGAAEDLMQQVG